MIIGVKELTISETREAVDDDDSDEERRNHHSGPSKEAIAKFEDFSKPLDELMGGNLIVIVVPYTKDGQAEAATKNSHLRLLFTLIGFEIVDKSEEFEYVLAVC